MSVSTPLGMNSLHGRLTDVKIDTEGSSGVVRINVDGQEFWLKRLNSGKWGKMHLSTKKHYGLPLEPSKGTQKYRILSALRKRRSSGVRLDRLISLGIAECSTVISSLRMDGWKIRKEEDGTGKRWNGNIFRKTIYFLEN